MRETSSVKDMSEMGRLSSALSKKSISTVEPRAEVSDSASNQSSESHSTSTHGPLRRSKRDPNCAQLDRPDVRSLVEKIKKNHKDTVVFKIKDHIPSDISSSVLDEIIHSFYRNKVCQAMYVQNISRAMGDTQLKSLLELLKRKQIWCLNIGENYEVTKAGWEYFCNTLPETSITHLYVSEHVIHIDLKNKMREHIRANRKKHDKHCSFKNLRVIEKCTNMWWNPINAIKHQIDQKFQPQHDNRTSPSTPTAAPIELTPCHTAYWAEGMGEGGSTPWKFSCVCGEVCSSYERYIYHPTGRMYECTRCHVWSHVDCVLGKISNDDLEELTEVYCGPCRAKVRRQKLLELKELNVVWENGRVVSDGQTSDDESISAAEKAQLVEDNVSRLVEEVNKQHCAKTVKTVDSASCSTDSAITSPGAAPTTPAVNAAPEPLIQPMNSAQRPQQCVAVQQPLELPPPPIPAIPVSAEDNEGGASGDHGDDDKSYGSTSNESNSGDTCGSADTSSGIVSSPRSSSEPESTTTQSSEAAISGDPEAATESMIEESILSTIMHSPPLPAQTPSEAAVTPVAGEVPFTSEVTPLPPMAATSVPSLSHLPVPRIEINYSIPQITNRSRARSETTAFPVEATPLLIPNAMQNDWANKNSFLTDLNTSSAPLLIKDILSRASFGDANRHRSFSVADMYDPRRTDGGDTLANIQTLMANTDKAPPPPQASPAPPKVKAESKKSDNGKEKPAKEKSSKQSKAQMKVKTEASATNGTSASESAPRKKRQSKGVRFQIYSRVYVPSIQRQGSIVQEKNGGWKYVQLDDIGDGVSDGKWCRACDMVELEDNGAVRPPPPVPASAPPSAEQMDEEMMFKRRRADSTGSDLFFGEDSLIQPHPTILTLTPDVSGFDDWPALGSTEGMDHFLEGLDAMDEWNL